MKQSDLYREQLKNAEELLKNWQYLGKQLNKTRDEVWRLEEISRRNEVNKLKLIVKRAEAEERT